MANHRGFSRADRVSEQILRELADLVRFHIKDPRVAAKMPLVTLSAVTITPDYAHAKVYYTSLADTEANSEIANALKRSSGYLRRELGRRIRLHQIPELHFVFDSTVAESSRLSQLIDQAVASDQGRGEDP